MGERDIEQILAERSRLAEAAFEAARKAFKEAAFEIPSELPPPDGTQRITNAGSCYRQAMKSYATALKEFNQFLVFGAVPEHLKEAIRIANRGSSQD